MTGFRAEAIRAAFLAVALAGWIGPAAGQTADAGVVQVQTLGSPDGPAAGLLETGNGGLGADIWQDTPRSRAEDMLARLPLATPVESVRALARRLVLTTADAPLGDAPHRFLSVRLKLLLDAGLIDEAGKLAAMAGTPKDPELARLVADSLLYARRTADICGPGTGLRLDSSDPFWMELRAYCYAVAGDQNMLDLTRAVMRAQNTDDPAFEALLDAVISHQARAPGNMQEPTSLDVFLLQSLGSPIDPAWSQHLGLPASVAAMEDTADTPDQQLEAAEDVVRGGAATTAQLAAIADAQAFAPDQLADAAAVAPTLPFVAGQALIRQAVQQAPDIYVRKRLLFAAFVAAERAGLLPVAAALQGDAASTISLNPTDHAHAALIASALLLDGHPDAAARCAAAFDKDSDSDKAPLALLQAELDLAAPGPARDADAQSALAFFAAQATEKTPAGGEPTRPLALLVLGTYEALGKPVPPEAASAIAVLKSHEWPGRRPGADIFTRLAAATKDTGRRGDIILSILDFIGPGGPGDVAPDATVAFVRALERMGYDDAATDLAVDSLVLYRPPPPPPSPPPSASAS